MMDIRYRVLVEIFEQIPRKYMMILLEGAIGDFFKGILGGILREILNRYTTESQKTIQEFLKTSLRKKESLKNF